MDFTRLFNGGGGGGGGAGGHSPSSASSSTSGNNFGALTDSEGGLSMIGYVVIALVGMISLGVLAFIAKR